MGERVKVLADATQALGALPFQVRQRAVASDTVNTGEQAGGGFAELHFVGADEPCQFSGANPPCACRRAWTSSV
ncbi:MAG: hypothetical protein HUU13_06910 [Burkholderiaceae bacterium]|nr:hypothetical protein [Burkholderiaceae bacterium]